MSKPHKKLIAWRKSMDLVEKVYDNTREFPQEEIYGLNCQIRRAAISAPSNIAESSNCLPLTANCLLL
jgi:four helix bundle protein